MKTTYVTAECCVVRDAAFASDRIGRDERPARSHGDYHRWPYGVRDTRRLAKGERLDGSPGYCGSYLLKTAQKVLTLWGK